MKTTITVKKMTLKPSSKEHIDRKLKKFDKFFDDNAAATVMLRPENDRVTAELTIRSGALVYRAEDTDVDLCDAFDSACDNIVRRIRKQKTKLEKRLRPSAFDDIPMSSEGEVADLANGMDTDEAYEIIKSKHFAMKPQSVQEAILQMEMLGHTFYMFRNEETGEINVVYARNDGKYGLIEPN